MRDPRSAVVVIGDELLLGLTVDTNSAWLADRLSLTGLPVTEIRTVGDQDEMIRAAVSDVGARVELVVITGGLGPTADDRTAAAIAEGRGTTPGELGSEVENALGTVPGCWVDPAGGPPAGPGDPYLLLMPGVPREMRSVFQAALPRIRAAFEDRVRPVRIRTLATTGIAESKLAPDVQAVVDEIDGVSVAFLPDLIGVDLRLTVRGRPTSEAEALLDRAEAALADLVGPWRLRSSAGDVVESLTDELLARGWTVAVGESCTGGGIGERITSRPGASRVFLGGLVTYTNDAKCELLGVPPELIDEHGAVSESVAAAMARGAARALGADCGIGISGIAGPGGGTDLKPVGTVCYAAVTPRAAVVTTGRFRGDREAVRRRSGQAAMVQLLRLLESEDA